MAIFTFSSLLILLLTSLPDLSDAAVLANGSGRNQIRGPKLSTLATDKNPKSYNRVDPVRDCSEMSTGSECVQSPKCRWCRSDAVDDTCFSKSEAWRLPSQVFYCDSWSAKLCFVFRQFIVSNWVLWIVAFISFSPFSFSLLLVTLKLRLRIFVD